MEYDKVQKVQNFFGSCQWMATAPFIDLHTCLHEVYVSEACCMPGLASWRLHCLRLLQVSRWAMLNITQLSPYRSSCSGLVDIFKLGKKCLLACSCSKLVLSCTKFANALYHCKSGFASCQLYPLNPLQSRTLCILSSRYIPIAIARSLVVYGG